MSDGTALRNVSDTAHWVAAYRAEESDRQDAHFRDPYARRLAGGRGFELLDAMPRGRRFSWPMVTRTVLFDRLITERLARGADVVLNLAAGLDARPYRMKLPPDLLWVEADLPPMIAYKSELLAAERPVCRLERVSIDLADGAARRAFLAEVGARGRTVLVLSEGLLIYLDPADVSSLADDLAAVPSMRSWVTDLCSPALLKMMSKTWGKEVAKAGAPFRFAPAEGPDWFAGHGWRAVARLSSLHEAGRLKRLPFPLSFFAKLPEPKGWNPKRIWGGVVLLERS
jgi:methyltransferase (TIGR00027 family)